MSKCGRNVGAELGKTLGQQVIGEGIDVFQIKNIDIELKKYVIFDENTSCICRISMVEKEFL
jgi:hypothetical protein